MSLNNVNKIIAAILTSSESANLQGGENDIFGVSGGSVQNDIFNTEPFETTLSGGKKRLPPRLKKWNTAFMEARRELGITGFVAMKKSAPKRSPSRKLYDLTRAKYDH